MLLIALPLQLSPRDKLKLSSLKPVYARPKTEKGHLKPLEMEQLKHALQVEEIVKTLMKYGNQVLPTPTTWPFTLCSQETGYIKKPGKPAVPKISSFLRGMGPHLVTPILP